MNSLKEIYVAYEIGDIYPENLPAVLIDVLDKVKQNEFLQKIVSLEKPTRSDMYEFLPEAFGISEKHKLTKLEKLDLLINRWFNHKISAAELKSRIAFFELENVYYSESFDEFMTSIDSLVLEVWIPSDTWDWIIENFKKDFKIENRYAEFLIKNSD